VLKGKMDKLCSSESITITAGAWRWSQLPVITM